METGTIALCLSVVNLLYNIGNTIYIQKSISATNDRIKKVEAFIGGELSKQFDELEGDTKKKNVELEKTKTELTNVKKDLAAVKTVYSNSVNQIISSYSVLTFVDEEKKKECINQLTKLSRQLNQSNTSSQPTSGSTRSSTPSKPQRRNVRFEDDADENDDNNDENEQEDDAPPPPRRKQPVRRPALKQQVKQPEPEEEEPEEEDEDDVDARLSRLRQQRNK